MILCAKCTIGPTAGWGAVVALLLLSGCQTYEESTEIEISHPETIKQFFGSSELVDLPFYSDSELREVEDKMHGLWEFTCPIAPDSWSYMEGYGEYPFSEAGTGERAIIGRFYINEFEEEGEIFSFVQLGRIYGRIYGGGAQRHSPGFNSDPYMAEYGWPGYTLVERINKGYQEGDGGNGAQFTIHLRRYPGFHEIDVKWVVTFFVSEVTGHYNRCLITEVVEFPGPPVGRAIKHFDGYASRVRLR